MQIMLAIGLGLSLLWLLVLSFFYYRLDTHYNRLIKGTDKRNLQETLNAVLREQHGH